VSQGKVTGAVRLRHGDVYVATTHNMWHDWSRIAPGVVLGTGLFAIYGLGLGALLKNQIVAIVVGLVFTLVVRRSSAPYGRRSASNLPGQAATALEDAARTKLRGHNPSCCPGGVCACMLLIYGIALAFLGTFTTLRSDVT